MSAIANDKTTTAGFESFVESTMATLSRRWKNAQARQMLLDLDDRTLEDIGLTREDVVAGRRPPRS